MFKSVAVFPHADSDLWSTALHCHICSEVHTRAIYYCEQGHHVCQKCANSTTHCLCGRKITKLRAEYLEHIVRSTRFHCEHDCGQSLTNEEYSFHVEEACRFRPINCPLCNTLIDYKNYLRHLKRVHNVGTYDLEEDGGGWLQISPNTEPMCITVFDDKTFFLRWELASSKFWVQSFQNPRGVTVQVESTAFRCNIRISKAHSGLNCPDTDVVRLVMNERVRLKFNALSEDVWTGPPSSSSNRNSAVLPTMATGGIRTLTNRTSAMSITSSSSSDGTTSTGLETPFEEEPPPLPVAAPPVLPVVSVPTSNHDATTYFNNLE